MNFSGLSNIDNKKKLMISALVFAIVFFLLSYFLLLPTIDEIKALKKDIISQKIELEKNKKRDKNVDKLSEDIKKISPELGLLNQVFIDKDKELEFITILEGLADKNRVTQAININKDKTTKLSLYYKTPITISVQGNYSDIIAYLKDIESMKLYLDINSLSISLNPDSETDSKMADKFASLEKDSLQLSADTFWK